MLLIAPIFIITLFYKPKFGISLIILGIVISSFLTIVPRVYYGIFTLYESKNFQAFISDLFYSVRTYYYSTHSHLNTFLFGLIIGYLIKKKPDQNFGGSIYEIFIWIVFSIFSTISLLLEKKFYQSSVKINYLEMLLSLAFGRLLFVSGFGWLFYMCSCGRAGN